MKLRVSFQGQSKLRVRVDGTRLRAPLKSTSIVQAIEFLPLLVVSLSMLIKIELQMAFRSVQKRSRTPQHARPPPTWSQHGANMGSKRSAKIGPRALEIWSRGDLRPKSLSDLSMDPKWTPDGPKCTQNIPRMESNSTPKSTSDGPFIDSQINFKSTIGSVLDPAIHELSGRVGS